MARGNSGLRHVHYEPMDDGTVTSRVTKRPTGKNKGAFLMDSDDIKGTHQTAEAAGAHLVKVLKAHGIASVKRKGSVGAKTEAY